ncbi:hypothetical protein EU528_12265 [Candidatus Thorarchaeota archaeon]|nr:MAG: hypothetical protein EU528_12265 [Candidatus Thorarchaeota archaeon]
METENYVSIILSSKEKALKAETASFLKGRTLPDLVNMDLDLYMSRLLLERYNASVEWSNETVCNLILKFPKAS